MTTNQTTSASAYVGVDISKDTLDLNVAGQSPSQYENTKKGIAKLIPALARLPASIQVICEPSGGYERDLLKALWAKKIAVSLVNASRVRSFARARGLLVLLR